MKFKLSLIAAMIAVASLSGCGGSSDSPSNGVPVASPAALSKIDTKVGTGAEAVVGKSLKVHYTGYLYSATAANNKGTQFETSIGSTPLPLILGTTNLIPGFVQGVTGMKVGGERTVLIPASLGYGAAGSRAIPPNSGLVFDLVLVEVQ